METHNNNKALLEWSNTVFKVLQNITRGNQNMQKTNPRNFSLSPTYLTSYQNNLQERFYTAVLHMLQKKMYSDCRM